jgi:hypothetical protein
MVSAKFLYAEVVFQHGELHGADAVLLLDAQYGCTGKILPHGKGNRHCGIVRTD